MIENRTHITHFPFEILEEIFKYLQYQDVQSFSLSCKRTYHYFISKKIEKLEDEARIKLTKIIEDIYSTPSKDTLLIQDPKVSDEDSDEDQAEIDYKAPLKNFDLTHVIPHTTVKDRVFWLTKITTASPTLFDMISIINIIKVLAKSGSVDLALNLYSCIKNTKQKLTSHGRVFELDLRLERNLLHILQKQNDFLAITILLEQTTHDTKTLAILFDAFISGTAIIRQKPIQESFYTLAEQNLIDPYSFSKYLYFTGKAHYVDEMLKVFHFYEEAKAYSSESVIMKISTRRNRVSPTYARTFRQIDFWSETSLYTVLLTLSYAGYFKQAYNLACNNPGLRSKRVLELLLRAARENGHYTYTAEILQKCQNHMYNHEVIWIDFLNNFQEYPVSSATLEKIDGFKKNLSSESLLFQSLLHTLYRQTNSSPTALPILDKIFLKGKLACQNDLLFAKYLYLLRKIHNHDHKNSISNSINFKELVMAVADDANKIGHAGSNTVGQMIRWSFYFQDPQLAEIYFSKLAHQDHTDILYACYLSVLIKFGDYDRAFSILSHVKTQRKHLATEKLSSHYIKSMIKAKQFDRADDEFNDLDRRMAVSELAYIFYITENVKFGRFEIANTVFAKLQNPPYNCTESICAKYIESMVLMNAYDEVLNAFHVAKKDGLAHQSLYTSFIKAMTYFGNKTRITLTFNTAVRSKCLHKKIFIAYINGLAALNGSFLELRNALKIANTEQLDCDEVFSAYLNALLQRGFYQEFKVAIKERATLIENNLSTTKKITTANTTQLQMTTKEFRLNYKINQFMHNDPSKSAAKFKKLDEVLQLPSKNSNKETTFDFRHYDYGATWIALRLLAMNPNQNCNFLLILPENQTVTSVIKKTCQSTNYRLTFFRQPDTHQLQAEIHKDKIINLQKCPFSPSSL